MPITTDPHRIAHFMATLSLDAGPPPDPVCWTCKGTWFCVCTDGPGIDWANIKINNGQPIRHDMLEIANARNTAAEEPQEPTKKRLRVHKELVKNKPNTFALPMQASWNEILELPICSKKLSKLPSARHAVEKWQGHCDISAQMPSDLDLLAHGKRVIDQIPSPKLFRVGMTVDPQSRFHESWCSYSHTAIQNRDRCDYEHMIVFSMHQLQEAAAMLEHCMIEWSMGAFPRRCINHRRELDNYERFNQHSSDEDGELVYFCYVVFGSARIQQTIG